MGGKEQEPDNNEALTSLEETCYGVAEREAGVQTHLKLGWDRFTQLVDGTKADMPN